MTVNYDDVAARLNTMTDARKLRWLKNNQDWEEGSPVVMMGENKSVIMFPGSDIEVPFDAETLFELTETLFDNLGVGSLRVS